MRKFAIFLMVFLFLATYCFAQRKENEYKKVEWEFSDKDFSLNLKEEQIKKGKHTFETSRRFSSKTESLLIKKAESLYPKTAESESRSPTSDKDVYKEKIFSPTPEEKPFWSTSYFDGVKIAGVVSLRAISYYQDLTAAYRKNQRPTSINMSETSFSYSASVKFYDKYEIADQKFENVNVVLMKLSWSQFCGNLCAMGFSREKIAVFDKNNEPVGLFLNLDDGAWVS